MENRMPTRCYTSEMVSVKYFSDQTFKNSYITVGGFAAVLASQVLQALTCKDLTYHMNTMIHHGQKLVLNVRL